MLPIILGLPFVAPALATSAKSISDALEKGLPADRLSEASAVAVVLKQGPPRTPVTSEVYEKLSYYAQFPGSATPCVHGPPSGIVEQLYINNTETDTQAMIYRLDSSKELILAIPGTHSEQDWATDTNLKLIHYSSTGSCKSCKVHRGFSTAWNSILDEAARGLESALQTYPSYTVTIVGHSLGGALAELAFGSLKPKPLNVSQVITYGAPRVGNKGFTDYLDKLAGASDSSAGISYRVTHYNDIVPHLPPFFMGFSHPRTEYWQSADKAEEATTYRCYGSEALDCIFGQNPSLESDAHGTYAGMKYFC